jgi:hypothetical protein
MNIRVKQKCDTFEIQVNGHSEKDHFMEKLKKQGPFITYWPQNSVYGVRPKSEEGGV